MPGKFEDPEHSDQSDDPQDGKRGALVLGLMVIGDDCAESNKVRNYCHKVDQVHDVFEKSQVVGGSCEPDQQFKREPHDAARFDDEEGLCELGNVITHHALRQRHHLRVDCSGVVIARRTFGIFEIRQGFKAESHDREEDDTDGKDGDDTGSDGAFGVLEEQPHVLLQLVGGHDLRLFLHDAFVFFVLLDHVVA